MRLIEGEDGGRVAGSGGGTRILLQEVKMPPPRLCLTPLRGIGGDF